MAITTQDMNDGFWITNAAHGWIGFHSERGRNSEGEKRDIEGVVFHWNFTEEGNVVCTDAATYEKGEMIHFQSYPEGFGIAVGS